MKTAAELLKAATSAPDALRTLLTDAIAVGIRVTSWAKGGPTRAIYYGVARALSVLSGKIEETANQGFRSTATGDALTLNVREVSGITRPGATYATTTLLISNTGGGNYPYSPNSPLIFLNTAKGKQYTSLGSGLIGPLSSNVPVAIKALEPGADSTALPNEIDDFVTPIDGCVISQPDAAIGVDEMSDDDLKAAADARVGFVPTAVSLGAGGAPGAYESIARLGADGGGGVLRDDGTRIAVTRARILDDGTGGVQVVVADEDGPITSDDLAYLDAAIKAYALTIGLSGAAAINATVHNYTLAYTLYVPESSSATDDEIKTAAMTGVVAYFQRVPIGGYELSPGVRYFPKEGVARAIANAVAPLVGSAVSITITSPSTDVLVLALTLVPVLNGTPTATITRVPGV